MITQQEETAPRASVRADGAEENVPACPACQAAADAVRALRAQATDAATVDAEFGWDAVCNTHAWQLAGHSEPARAIVAARLQAALQRLGEGNSAGAGRLGQRKASARTADQGECRFCTAMRTAAEPVLATASMKPTGLCLPHLCTALGSARRREHVQALAGAALMQFTALEEELSELIRKSDYRFRDEPRGREATSWTRTAQLLAGVPAVRWPLRQAPDIEG